MRYDNLPSDRVVALPSFVPIFKTDKNALLSVGLEIFPVLSGDIHKSLAAKYMVDGEIWFCLVPDFIGCSFGEG